MGRQTARATAHTVHSATTATAKAKATGVERTEARRGPSETGGRGLRAEGWGERSLLPPPVATALRDTESGGENEAAAAAAAAMSEATVTETAVLPSAARLQMQRLSLQSNGLRRPVSIVSETSGSAGEFSDAERAWFRAACQNDSKALVELLRQDGQLVRRRDFLLGFTALHWAVRHSTEFLITRLLRSGAEVHARSHGGYAPLLLAALAHDESVVYARVRSLARRGAAAATPLTTMAVITLARRAEDPA